MVTAPLREREDEVKRCSVPDVISMDMWCEGTGLGTRCLSSPRHGTSFERVIPKSHVTGGPGGSLSQRDVLSEEEIKNVCNDSQRALTGRGRIENAQGHGFAEDAARGEGDSSRKCAIHSKARQLAIASRDPTDTILCVDYRRKKEIDRGRGLRFKQEKDIEWERTMEDMERYI